MLYGRSNGLSRGPKRRAICCLREGWKWSWGPVGGKQGIYMSKKEWASKKGGEKWNRFRFLALQATPHTLSLVAKNSRKKMQKGILKKRELHVCISLAWKLNFQHMRAHLIALSKLYTLIFSLSSKLIILMLAPLVASYVLSVYG